MKSLFQGNPSDTGFSHYHNNWHSTALSKSLADWDRITTREEKGGGHTVKNINHNKCLQSNTFLKLEKKWTDVSRHKCYCIKLWNIAAEQFRENNSWSK